MHKLVDVSGQPCSMDILAMPPGMPGQNFEDVYDVILVLDDREQFGHNMNGFVFISICLCAFFFKFCSPRYVPFFQLACFHLLCATSFDVYGSRHSCMKYMYLFCLLFRTELELQILKIKMWIGLSFLERIM